MIKYKVCWSAFSNIRFKGDTGWQEWYEDEGQTLEDVQSELENPADCSLASNIPPVLSEALEASGFEYWVEVREVLN